MPSLLTLAAPFALFLPMLGQSSTLVQAGAQAQVAGKTADTEETARPNPPPEYELPPQGPFSRAFPAQQDVTSPLDAFRGGQILRQHRIEQRIIIRISPRRGSPRNDLLAQLPRQGLNTRYEERSMDRCVPVNRISGVQTGTGNRLLLFLQDQRIISINLERACRARDFYSGFYIERNEDGRLCVDRDELQSRSGARCEVERMRQLVAVED